MDVLTIEQVLAYARPLIHKFIFHHAADLPAEQKEEILQSAFLRLFKVFGSIDQSQGWRSYVYTHCRGAVLDYLKFGKGFQESKWSLNSSPDKTRTPKLTRRLTIASRHEHESHEASLDRTLGKEGIFSVLDLDRIEIKWGLLARMSSIDDSLHAFAKTLRGISIEEMCEPIFGLCRTRVSQMVQSVVERFDDPKLADEFWFKQTCYALDLCRKLGMEDIDQSEVMGFPVGWALKPVDLDSLEPRVKAAPGVQLGFFDGEKAH